MRAMARAQSTAADPPYAPDLPPAAEPLASLDAAALRDTRGSSLVGVHAQAADLGGAKLPGLRLLDAEEPAP